MAAIHKSAIIQKGASIGDDVEIGPYCFISSGAKISDGCKIMQGAIIDGNTTLHKNCTVYYNSVIGSSAQYLNENSKDASVEIGEGTTIREFCHINSGTQKGGGVTTIGKECYIMAYVHIAHDAIVGDNVILTNNATVAGHVEIGNSAVLGGMCAIHQFAKIGDYAMVGGGSMVSQDIPPYCLCEGNRAVIKGLNAVGLKRNIANPNDRLELKSAYKALFRSKGAIKEIANELRKSSKNTYVQKLCAFIIESKRGVPVKGRDNG